MDSALHDMDGQKSRRKTLLDLDSDDEDNFKSSDVVNHRRSHEKCRNINMINDTPSKHGNAFNLGRSKTGPTVIQRDTSWPEDEDTSDEEEVKLLDGDDLFIGDDDRVDCQCNKDKIDKIRT